MAEGRILVISNNQALCYHAGKDLVKYGFIVVVENNEERGRERYYSDNFDVVILSLRSDDIEHNKILSDIKLGKSGALAVVVTNNYSPRQINNMPLSGVFSFLSESFEPKDLFLAVKQAMAFHKMKNSIRIHEQRISLLERRVVVLTKKVGAGVKNTVSLYRDLQDVYMRSIKALAQAIDMRDKYTYSHSENVTKYAVAIAEEMRLSFQEVKDIRDACELHDIGKIGIQDDILIKHSNLTNEEWEQMKQHPLKGAQILEPLNIKNVIELVKEHHEHYDGTGYPQGKKDGKILLGARIISLADAYDAMISERAYRNACFSKEDAINEIKRNSGLQFDPKIVEVFLRIINNRTVS
ncbi:MAG: HD domain-containing phosphohydrolase [Candidatus Omnitrophota bacterium]